MVVRNIDIRIMYDIVVKFKIHERPLNIHGFPQFLDQLIIIPKGKKLEGLRFRNQEFFFPHTFLDHPNAQLYDRLLVNRELRPGKFN